MKKTNCQQPYTNTSFAYLYVDCDRRGVLGPKDICGVDLGDFLGLCMYIGHLHSTHSGCNIIMVGKFRDILGSPRISHGFISLCSRYFPILSEGSLLIQVYPPYFQEQFPSIRIAAVGRAL